MVDVGISVGPDVVVRITDEEDKAAKAKINRARLILGKLVAAQAIVQEKIRAMEEADA